MCPDEAKFFIKGKNKCLDDCIKDDVYKFKYKGECLEQCPESTFVINNDYICRENIDNDKCIIDQKDLAISDFSDQAILENLVKRYSEESNNQDNYISLYNNDNYNLLIFQNSSCVNDLDVKSSNFDFGECYTKIKDHYNIEKDLIIAFLENIQKDKNNPSLSIEIFHPETGEKLEALSICKNDTIVINQNMYAFIDENDTNYDILIDLLNKDINIFDPNDDFYTDLCFYYLSPKKKDIPIKDRLLEFYPNITLCHSGCKNIGINKTSHEALCECKYNDILNIGNLNNDLMEDTLGNIKKIVDESNIEVLKCLKEGIEHFTENAGGFIVGGMAAVSIGSTVLFYLFNYSGIKIFIFNLTQNFCSTFMSGVQSLNLMPLAPPKLKKIVKFDDNAEKDYDSKKKKKKDKDKDKFDKSSNRSRSEKFNNLFTEKLSAKSNEKLFKPKKRRRSIKNTLATKVEEI
jgi:hypothetical protein